MMDVSLDSNVVFERKSRIEIVDSVSASKVVLMVVACSSIVESSSFVVIASCVDLGDVVRRYRNRFVLDVFDSSA